MMTFNTPRWGLFMEHASPVALAKKFQKARRKEYNPERTNRQIEHAKKYRSDFLELGGKTVPHGR